MATKKKPTSDLEVKQDLIIETPYETYLKSIKENVNGIAVSYIMIGYYLNQLVKDETYKTGGYETINDLAKHEFNLSDTTIRNSMGVASKYADENGQLKDEFKDYKFSALVELLPVSEEKVLIDYSPEMTVTEIRDKKKQDKPKIDKTSSPEIKNQIKYDQITINEYPYLDSGIHINLNDYINGFINILLFQRFSNMYMHVLSENHLEVIDPVSNNSDKHS